MIIHRYHDGSEGFEYEIGDKVTVKRATVETALGHSVITSDGTPCDVVGFMNHRTPWSIRFLRVKHPKRALLDDAAAFNVRPSHETYQAASVVHVPKP